LAVAIGLCVSSGEQGVPSARRVVGVSLAVDLLDIVTNLIVAVLTGSAVIFAEMAQGIADAIGSLLLVVGERRSRLPGDDLYPSGHTREVFFWALLSSMTMLVVGSGLSFWRGYVQLVRLEPLDRPTLALAILVVSVTTNGYAVSQSYRRLRASGPSFRAAFREESQPLVKTAFLQDSLGTASAIVGLLSLILYASFGSVALFDALGAMAIAGMMVVFSVVLIVQAHHLITGRAVPGPMLDSIHDAVLSVPEVEGINSLVATFAGSRDVTLELDLDLAEGLTTAEIEEVLDRLEAVVHEREPQVKRLRVDLNSPPGPPRRRRRRHR
jgi:cation diffusion facilitator family transporter